MIIWDDMGLSQATHGCKHGKFTPTTLGDGAITQNYSDFST